MYKIDYFLRFCVFKTPFHERQKMMCEITNSITEVVEKKMSEMVMLLATRYNFSYEEAIMFLKSESTVPKTVVSKPKTICEKSSAIFEKIVSKCRSNHTLCNMLSSTLKTKDGDTQTCERSYISVVSGILDEMKLTYTQAGSQQPYDFRIRMPGHEDFNPSDADIRNHNLTHNGEQGMLLLECKKTDSVKIICNDTVPSDQAFYLILGTKKKNKKKSNKPAFILGVNGYELIESSPWLRTYKNEVNMLKEKYKDMEGTVSVYPRPNISVNVQPILENYLSESIILTGGDPSGGDPQTPLTGGDPSGGDPQTPLT